MDNVKIFFLIVFALLVLFGIFAIAAFYLKNAIRKYIAQNSEALDAICGLNDEYRQRFAYIGRYYEKITFPQKSKNTFDRLDYYQRLQEVVSGQKEKYRTILQATQKNREIFAQYSAACSQIWETRNTRWYRFSKMEKIEKQMFEEEKLNPVRYYQIIIEKSYSSPKGRNYYVEEQPFNEAFIQKALTVIEKAEEFRQSKEYQRSIMTDSLRYDIMKRDGFRCVLCGRKAGNGLTLHVDHIKPVSKGGKTIPENLRTLCDQCNLGKSAKYDYHGNN